MRSLGKIILDDEISDDELRAQLFAVVSREELVACMDNIGEWVTGKRSDLFHGIVRRHGMLRKFSPALLDAFLGRPIDEYPGNARLIQTIKGIFLAGKWWLVFDILETALDMQDVMDFAEEFAIESINKALAESAYMLVYDEITERLPVEQSVSIETALTSPFCSARTHFEKAFRALNRRPECEPGEVIRESIHAVEATCRELCGDQNAELGKTLAKLDKQHQFHPVLRQAIEKLYAWTGDASGARNALKEEQWRKTGKAEAQLALVTCSGIADMAGSWGS